MKKAPRPPAASPSAGFSTLDALVALLVIALVGLAAVQAVSGGLAASAGGRARGAAAVRLLQLDAALRRAVGAIDVPFWAGAVEADETADGLRLPYSGGEAARSLRIRASGGWIVLDTIDAEAGEEAASPAVRLGPFAEVSVAPLYEEQQLWGVGAAVRLREGMDAVELRARIGSRPLVPAEAP